MQPSFLFENGLSFGGANAQIHLSGLSALTTDALLRFFSEGVSTEGWKFSPSTNIGRPRATAVQTRRRK
jgi:hypothetical protein